jgi:hypothetical protein
MSSIILERNGVIEVILCSSHQAGTRFPALEQIPPIILPGDGRLPTAKPFSPTPIHLFLLMEQTRFADQSGTGASQREGGTRRISRFATYKPDILS